MVEEEEEFNALDVYLGLLGDLVENQEDGKISKLKVTLAHNGAPHAMYNPVEKLGIFQGSEDLLIIDNGCGVYTEIIDSGLKFEIKEFEV